MDAPGSYRGGGGGPRASRVDLKPLAQLLERMRESSVAVDRLPPHPPTLRGRIGRLLILAVRRALSWYTANIVAHQTAAVRLAQEQHKALARLATALEQNVALSAQVLERLNALAGELKGEHERQAAVTGTRISSAAAPEQNVPREMVFLKLEQIEESIRVEKSARESMIWDTQDMFAAAQERTQAELQNALKELAEIRALFESAGPRAHQSHTG